MEKQTRQMFAAWHYGDGQGSPHPTKNDWVGTFSTPEKQAEFEAVTTNVLDGQFVSEGGITQISLPKCEIIGISSFFNANLTYLNLPECIDVGGGAFSLSNRLTSLSLPKAKIIRSRAFHNAPLTSLDMPECIEVEENAFENSQLTSLSLPKVKYIRVQSFKSAHLTSLSLPECIDIGEHAFNSSLLTSLNLPKVRNIRNVAFATSPLTSISIPKCTIIGFGAFEKVVNNPTTSVTMANIFNDDSEKNNVFGRDHWDQINFSWVDAGRPIVNWHYDDGFGNPSATTNDWKGNTSLPLQHALLQVKDSVIGDQFKYLSGVSGISLPLVENIGKEAFLQSKFTDIILPRVNVIGNNAFAGTVNDPTTKVTLPDIFNTEADKNRIFGQNNWTRITFNWVHLALPSRIIYEGKICDTQYVWNGKTVAKFIYNGKECVLKVPSGNP